MREQREGNKGSKRGWRGVDRPFWKSVKRGGRGGVRVERRERTL